MKKVVLILALFVAFGTMAYALESSSASASVNMNVMKAVGLKIEYRGNLNPIDLGMILPGTNHTFSIPEQQFYVTGQGGYDAAGVPAPVGANIDWTYPGAAITVLNPQNDKWEVWPSAGELYIVGNMRYGTDGGINDRESLAPDGIAAVYFKPMSIAATPTFTATGPVVIPVNVTVSYDPGQ